jgi:type I restriction enzyme S subunit
MSQAELTTLGKSCGFFNGKAHEKDIDENGKYIVVNSKFISSDGTKFKRTNEQMFPLYKGDIVMVMSDVPNGKALAKCFIIDKDDTYSLNQRICCIRSKEFDTKYLYYQLNRHEHFLAFNNGENQTNLRKDDILDCPLIKPSIEEQRRMVVEFDEAFTKLALAKSNLEKNLSNAKELFDGELREIASKKEEGWLHKKLGEVCKLTRGHNPPKSKFISNPKEGYVRFYQIRDGWSDEYKVYVPKTPQLHLVEPDEILMVAYRHIGKAFRGVSGAFNVALCKITNKRRDILDDDFLFYLIPTDLIRGELLKRSERSLIPSMSVEHLKQLEIPIPPMEIQKTLLASLDNLKNQSILLEEKYQAKLDCIEELRTGILKRAFENELIEVE